MNFVASIPCHVCLTGWNHSSQGGRTLCLKDMIENKRRSPLRATLTTLSHHLSRDNSARLCMPALVKTGILTEARNHLRNPALHSEKFEKCHCHWHLVEATHSTLNPKTSKNHDTDYLYHISISCIYWPRAHSQIWTQLPAAIIMQQCQNVLPIYNQLAAYVC